MKDEKNNKVNLNNISAFVNARNYNLPLKNHTLIAVLFFNALNVFSCFILDDQRLLALIVALGIFATHAFSEGYVYFQLKKTKKSKWYLLPNNISLGFVGCSLIFISEVVLLSESVSIIFNIAGILLAICSFITMNFFTIHTVKNGKYIDIEKREKKQSAPNLRNAALRGTVAGSVIIVVMPILKETLGEKTLFFSWSILGLIAGCILVMLTPGFLKFYYATKYNIEVIPTWLDKYESIPFEKFQYQAESGKGFYVVINQKRKPSISYIIELFPHDRKGDGTALKFDMKSYEYEKEAFHIDTVLNENGIVCYALNGAPFGNLSDGQFIDFRRVQLEGEPNPEIVWIGETLIQQDIRWFDDFGEYLVKSGSRIGVETAKRYQDKNFTEVELQQIAQQYLNADEIAKWAEEILLAKEKGIHD